MALLVVLGGILLLYIGPARSYFSTLGESKVRQAEVQRLERENARLQARRRALSDPRSLETEARRLGMVKPEERAWVIDGLPED